MGRLGYEFANKIVENMVIPTFVLDATGRVIIWNKACERLTGIMADEVVGTRDHWRAFYEEPRDCLADIILSKRPEELDRLYPVHSDPNGDDKRLRAENWCVMPRLGKQHYLAIDAGPIYDETGRLMAVAETISDVTEKHLAEEALRDLALKDSLTGLANRRSFDMTLTTEWNRSARDHASLSVLLIDIDYFKAYNDEYGHQAGDECLKRVALAMAAQSFRPADTVARYGGEEFAVILPSTDRGGAVEVAERIRDAVQILAIPQAGSDTGNSVTVSVGTATEIPSPGGSLEALLSRADKALYTAKRCGRNRVEASG